MGVRTWGQLLAVTICLAAAAPIAEAQPPGRRQPPGRTDQRSNAYQDGYREGVQRGAQDARSRRLFSSSSYSGANTDYRRGFAEGYRVGYDREHASEPLRRPDARVYQQPSPRATGRGYREPAFAGGFESGYDKGLEDGRDGDRYDPVRHRDYRDAERGYRDSYGSRDAYRNNFRAGFRQGYEEGYRAGARNRR